MIAEAPQRRGLRTLIITILVFLLTPLLTIALQIGGMLVTGWGVQGWAWIVTGFAIIPLPLAIGLHIALLEDRKRAVIRGTIVGASVSVSLLLLCLALLVAAGPMDGGI